MVLPGIAQPASRAILRPSRRRLPETFSGDIPEEWFSMKKCEAERDTMPPDEHDEEAEEDFDEKEDDLEPEDPDFLVDYEDLVYS